MTTLLIIRHGESQTNRTVSFAGQFDTDLEENGVFQAKLTAEYIKTNYKVDKIYSSDLIRAYKTAMVIGDALNLEVIKDVGLREINGGAWHGMKYSDIEATYPKEYYLWANDIGKSACPGGESVKELGNRIMATLKEIAEENNGKTIVIATHAVPIRVSQAIIELGSVEKMQDIPWVSNASVSVYKYENGNWSLGDISIDGHLGESKTKVKIRA